MEIDEWDIKHQRDESNNEYFLFPNNEIEFKKAVFADNTNKGLVIRIFKNNGEFMADRIVNSKQEDWTISPYIFVSNTYIDGEPIRYKYKNCKIYAVPNGYEGMLPQITQNNIKPKGETMTPIEPNNAISKTPPLNQILYGPPGTGKTYNTINKALEILGVETQGKSRAELKTKFDEFRQNGQIEFITFHQSFSYEEFVEGIKPIFVDENGNEAENSNNMVYKSKDGIFKEICSKAKENLRRFNIDDGKIDAGEVFDKYAEQVQEKLTKEEAISFGKNNVKILGVVDFKNSANAGLRCTTSSGKTPIWITREMILRDYDSYKNGTIKEAKDIISNNTGKKHAQSWWYLDFYEELKKFEENKNIQTTKKTNIKPYILIIDEINRGNISKILGELITLIEPSKRIGASEEEKARGIGNESLKITLPYSNETFGVPSNLYIIGTMNTADRSIALLDTALRRRFEFVEMMPEPELLKNIWIVKDTEQRDNENQVIPENRIEELDKYMSEKSNFLYQILNSINNRIEFLLDREHTIGHAFFFEKAKFYKNDELEWYELTLESLKEIFVKKIIPLLQEYFYDDYKKIQAVLNDNQMIKPKPKPDFLGKFNDEVDSEKVVYEIVKSQDWAVWQFVKIYDSKAGNSQKSSESNDNGE